jgi:hypothetical protein
MKEQWKSIQGYEGLYSISNFGNVKRLARSYVNKTGKHYTVKEGTQKPFLQVKSTTNYKRVALHKDGVCSKWFVHRLVADAFITNISPETNTQINHKDYNGENNHYTNLEWVTPSENEKYSRLNGRNKDKSAKAGRQSNLIKREAIEEEIQSRVGTLIGHWKVLSTGPSNVSTTSAGYTRTRYTVNVTCTLCNSEEVHNREYWYLLQKDSPCCLECSYKRRSKDYLKIKI